MSKNTQKEVMKADFEEVLEKAKEVVVEAPVVEAPVAEVPAYQKCRIINLDDACVDGRAIPFDANERGSVVIQDNLNGTYVVGYEDTCVAYGVILATNVELL